MARVPESLREESEVQKKKAETLARVNSHAGERMKGLRSSRWLKALGAAFLLAGTAALSAGIAFSSILAAGTLTKLLAAGLASSVWGLGVFIAGNIKGRFNKHSKP